MLRIVLFAGAFALSCSALAQDAPPKPFAERLAAILPQQGETDWRELRWGTELRAALVAADRQQKPILLWAMNGHPLGQC